jgi:hypothetical protein
VGSPIESEDVWLSGQLFWSVRGSKRVVLILSLRLFPSDQKHSTRNCIKSLGGKYLVVIVNSRGGKTLFVILWHRIKEISTYQAHGVPEAGYSLILIFWKRSQIIVDIQPGNYRGFHRRVKITVSNTRTSRWKFEGFISEIAVCDVWLKTLCTSRIIASSKINNNPNFNNYHQLNFMPFWLVGMITLVIV